MNKEIPSFDREAKIEILIGREAPKLLRFQAFKNDSRSAPWAQKLSLSWTVAGQMCLESAETSWHADKDTNLVRGAQAVYWQLLNSDFIKWRQTLLLWWKHFPPKIGLGMYEVWIFVKIHFQFKELRSVCNGTSKKALWRLMCPH